MRLLNVASSISYGRFVLGLGVTSLYFEMHVNERRHSLEDYAKIIQRFARCFSLRCN